MPAIKGEAYPAGLQPWEDEIEVRRTIAVSANVKLRGSATTRGGRCSITVVPYGKHSRLDSIPFADLDATVAAMGFLKAWLQSESDRLVIRPQPAEKVEEREEDDEDEDGPAEE